KPVRAASGNLGAEGNPLGEDRAKRADWAKDLPVPRFTEDAEVLYFSCCYLSYDRRLRKVAAATATVLDRAGVRFGTLGASESCCGESIRKTGDEDMFRRLARENIKAFIDNGVKRVLVSSPHCYHTFKNEYPEFMVNFEVVHATEYVLELIRDGRITPTRELAATVAYHDPCYLGRHNGIYDAPREILRSIPGLQLVELPDSREDSLCCGGGGGRIWMDTPKGERFSDLRVEQAAAVGASVLATACPYCIANFEDSRLAMADADALEVKDVMELVQASL
ncbi:MAG TPA: (Fe-S)-binding protein, partial [Deferrisomatales bacterium]|nr:(Fe-S)-binding protein [Deferrisomatales bacterium]